MSSAPFGPPAPGDAPPVGTAAIWAIVTSFGLTVAGIVLVVIFGGTNTIALVTALSGMLMIFTTGLFSLIKGQQANHIQMNSRLSEYLAEAAARARAEGMLEAHAQHESAAASAARIAADVATAVQAAKPSEAAASEGG